MTHELESVPEEPDEDGKFWFVPVCLICHTNLSLKPEPPEVAREIEDAHNTRHHAYEILDN